MSIDNLSDEELLELAQATASLTNKVYDASKSSVWNYTNMNRFKNSIEDKVAFRVPLSLAYLHYKDWLLNNYPHILPHSQYEFSKEILLYINSTSVKNVNFLLIRNCKEFRKYKDHPYNKFLVERARKKYNAWQRKNR